MEKIILESLCKKIYKRFPEVNGKKPKVKKQNDSRYLIIFQGSGKTADGHSIPRTVRVVATETGKIIKTTTSR